MVTTNANDALSRIRQSPEMWSTGRTKMIIFCSRLVCTHRAGSPLRVWWWDKKYAVVQQSTKSRSLYIRSSYMYYHRWWVPSKELWKRIFSVYFQLSWLIITKYRSLRIHYVCSFVRQINFRLVWHWYIFSGFMMILDFLGRCMSFEYFDAIPKGNQIKGLLVSKEVKQ